MMVEDHLEEDPELRSQKYVCLSFISPEDVIKRKEAFACEKFLSSLSADINELLDNLSKTLEHSDEATSMISGVRDRYEYILKDGAINDEYNAFLTKNADTIDNEYMEENKFQTCVRGIKVRGSYETMGEAENRAKQIQRFDKRFNVYVAQVGCWCPWNPDPNNLSVEYADTQLNTLMKKYFENQTSRDMMYQERKQVMAHAAALEAEASEVKIVQEEEEEETPSGLMDSML